MPILYKTTTLNGKPISTHRKLWILAYGPIPDGCHIHHKNGDKFDNRLENLECVTSGQHAAIHGTGRPAWNKGMPYGQMIGFKKALESRKANYLETCKRTYDMCLGRTQGQVAAILGISRRQVSDRLRHARANGYVPNGTRPVDAASSRVLEQSDGVSPPRF